MSVSRRCSVGITSVRLVANGWRMREMWWWR